MLSDQCYDCGQHEGADATLCSLIVACLATFTLRRHPNARLCCGVHVPLAPVIITVVVRTHMLRSGACTLRSF